MPDDNPNPTILAARDAIRAENYELQAAHETHSDLFIVAYRRRDDTATVLSDLHAHRVLHALTPLGWRLTVVLLTTNAISLTFARAATP